MIDLTAMTDITLLHGDCLDWMLKLPAASVDFIFCDPPFNKITAGKLKEIDALIPIDQMWECFRHVLKSSGTVIVFGTQPFISQIIVSNPEWFRYDLIWKKPQSGFLNCNKMPMREHQQIAVFSPQAPTPANYNPQKSNGSKYKRRQPASQGDVYGSYETNTETINNGDRHPTSIIEEGSTYNPQMEVGTPYIQKRNKEVQEMGRGTYQPVEYQSDTINNGTRFPSSIQEHKQSQNVHPFQKPDSLCEWLIKTYSNQGMVVLDPTMGSGSSGVASKRLKRKFIGIERDENWFVVARDRITDTEPEEERLPLAELFYDDNE